MKTNRIFCYLISAILLIGLVSAGFGSTYVPEIDGKDIIKVPIGTNSDYFIYPQNYDNKILLVKVKILNGSNILANTLQETYEVPVNTSSDKFPIKLTFRLNNDTSLIGKEYFVSYELLSTFKGNDTDGIVTFSPVGYKKSFYIKGIDYVPIIPVTPINVSVNVTQNTTETTTTTTTTSSSSSSDTSVVKKQTEPVIPTPVKIETPQPVIEKPTEISVVPTSFLASINWIYFVSILGGICILGVVVFAIKGIKNKEVQDYSNYNQEIE